MPKISVIVPAYNAQDYLEKCIASILNQSFKDIELIIVDDGSKDRTAEICDKSAASDGRVRVIHQANGGVSRARSAGLDTASGEYIAFVDTDDYILPEAYETMLAEIEKTGADTALCNFLAESPSGETSSYGAHIPGGYYTAADTKKMIVDSLLSRRLEADFNGFVWCYLFRRDIIEKNHIRFTGAYLEDELFLIEYFSLSSSLAVTDKELYRYLLNPASVTRRYLKNYTDTFEKSFEIKRELVKKYNIQAAPDWEYTTAWAGLLIAIGNEFAPGNEASRRQKIKNLRALCQSGEFAEAVKNHKPHCPGRKKAVVAALVRRRMYRLLAYMYEVKNSRRS